MGGSCTNSATGTIDAEKLKSNMNLAIDAYISRVDGCPCGSTKIHLFRGPEASEEQVVRSKLLIFLKGSKKQKQELKDTEPTLFEYFQNVWKVRNDHMVPELPAQYIFFLLCCYKDGCIHPCCQAGTTEQCIRWYPGGPPISYLPLPVVDSDRPWGNLSCSTCSGSKFCSGHYKLQVVDVRSTTSLKQMSKPPSSTLKERFASVNMEDQNSMQQIAQEVLLPPEECRI